MSSGVFQLCALRVNMSCVRGTAYFLDKYASKSDIR